MPNPDKEKSRAQLKQKLNDAQNSRVPTSNSSNSNSNTSSSGGGKKKKVVKKPPTNFGGGKIGTSL